MRFVFALLATLVGAPFALLGNNLVAPFTGGNANDGIMFDVVATADVQLDGVLLSLDTAGFVPVEVYTRAGTWQGFESSSADWQLIFSGSVFVTTASVAPSTAVAFNGPVQIAAGGRAALYVTVPDTGAAVVYTNGTSTPPDFGPVVGNNDLQILEGAGVQYPFGGLAQPRSFNGVLNYSYFTPTPTPTPSSTPAVLPTLTVTGSRTLSGASRTRRLTGTARAATSVRVRLRQVAAGRPVRTSTRTVSVSSGGKWATNIRLVRGANIAVVQAVGPGGVSAPVTVRITRR